MRSFTTHDGTERRNPIRNQIDFVIAQKEVQHLIQDARSYGGTYTSTDHKMIVMKITLKEHKLRRQKERGEPKIRIEELNNEEKRKEYEEATKLVEVDPNKSPQERWNTIVNKCKEIGKKVLGKRDKRDRIQNPTLKKLTEEKQKIRKDINADK